MNWVHLAAVAAAAAVLATYTDWLLAGDWVQKRLGDQQIWRDRSILVAAASTALPFITCVGFALLAHKLEIFGLHNSLKLGFAIWVVGPLPLIISNALFLKMSRSFAALHAASWLVKLMIVAVVAGKYVH